MGLTNNLGKLSNMITSTGSAVGINNSSPANLLHLAGNVSTPSLRLGSTSLAFYWDIGRENASTGDFVFNCAQGGASSERMRITTGGNVVIGASAPLYSLHVVKPSANAFIGVSNQGVADGNRQLIMGFGGNGSETFATIKGTRYNVADDVNIAILGGNVGIGTTSPTGQLSIANQISNGSNPVSSYAATSGVNGQNFFNGYYAVNSDGSGTYPRYFDIVSVGSPDGTNGGSNIRLFTNPIATSSPAVERMRISSNGNVGIGAITPAATLSIKGAANNTVIEFENGGATKAFMRSYDRTGGAYREFEMLANYLLFSTGSSPSEKMRITSDGLVYIGASSMPNGQRFGITGSGVWDGAAIGLQNTGSGGQTYTMFSTNSSFSQGAGNFLLYNPSGIGNCLIVYSNGNYAFGGSNVSDKRLKQDIEDLNFGLSEIMKISPKSYYLKSENNLNGESKISLKKNYGFIAQEMQEVLPEIVTGKETETEYLGLDYNSVLAVAVKAIQELEARIKTLENK